MTIEKIDETLSHLRARLITASEAASPIDIHMEAGYDEHENRQTMMMEARLNGSFTFIIRINGGAHGNVDRATIRTRT
jgi:hypothetical protein